MKKLFLLLILMAVGLGNMGAGGGCATTGGKCYSGYPQGVAGTVRTYVDVYSGGNINSGYKFSDPNVAIAYIQNALSQKAAANPNGPQFQFISRAEFKKSDLYVNAVMFGKFTGGTSSSTPIGTGWAEVNATGLNSDTTWLFGGDVTQTYTFTEDSQPLNSILDEAANIIYNHIANGWTCK
jgi:hypothetical protein